MGMFLISFINVLDVTCKLQSIAWSVGMGGVAV